MLETHLHSPITRQRLRNGAAAEHIDAFADWLHLSGYRPTSIDNGLTSLAAWTDWMLTAGFTTQDVLAGFEACKLAVNQERRVPYSRGPQSAIHHGRLVVHPIPPTAGRTSAACSRAIRH
jgi:integrase/recombinase XerD